MNRFVIAAALALAISTAACDRTGEAQHPSSGAASTSTHGIHFIESVGGSPKPGLSGITVSIAIDSPALELHVTGVEAVTDQGLKATYLGYSYCQRAGCGVMFWDADVQALMRDALDGTLPIDVPTTGERSRPSLIFLLEAEGSGVQTVKQRCLLVTGVRLTLRDEGEVLVRSGSDGLPVAGLEAWEKGPNYQRCEDLWG